MNYHKYIYVNSKPYEAIILGHLSPGMLLYMPDSAVCEALLEGIPVYYWQKQYFRNAKHGRVLQQELQKREQYLFRLGVMPIGRGSELITAEQARCLRKAGLQPSAASRMTPLARDILEGIES